ncbi:hypothetical protein JCM17844_12790 [Iodidimonas gelatinilytica]|uniref:histidine kinase n=1 Tax=Iodidimonas gelatinilytica TaxID=1236966 RepID=A0A5A7MNP8_9PROT|nr:PAS domain-containing hybrid sensor histidine kinase/response regulator [Iodidimonas gelatinilytica]GEQ97642.1 hypothetical protein JCM17844_12790 [Iodidimonas gelatinilytica]
MRDSEAAKAGIVQAALDGVITVDETGTVIDFNDAAATIFGWSPDEIIGRSILDTVIPDHAKPLFAHGITKALTEGKRPYVGRRTEITAQRRDGTRFPAELSLVDVHTERGRLFTGFIRDISTRLEAERRLRDARDEAQAASRAKSDFLATISHEIRTPMNGVLGALDLLLEDRLDPNQERLAATARDASEALRVLLDDLLDYSRIEAGKLAISPTSFSPASLIDTCCAIFTAQAQAKGLTLDCSSEGEIPALISGDESRLRQMLLNLISNAMKFTPQGHVHVLVKRLAGDDGFCILRFEVSDSGIGITPAFREQIFSKFSQADPANSRRHGGSGLGLAIVKGLVELMGGSVDFESTPGKGSRFWCDLPFLVTQENSAAPSEQDKTDSEFIGKPSSSDLAQAKILVVDDSAANRLVTSEMLRRSGAIVLEANSGPDALKQLDAETIDLVLMDISMPGMDGIETTETLRKRGHRILPVIALTAQAGTEAKSQFQALGFDAFLPKPIHREALVATVEALIRGRRLPTLPQQSPGEETMVEALDQAALNRMGAEVGSDLLQHLINTFIDEAGQRRSAIAKAAEQRDYDSLQINAHALKSAASTFGANRLSAEAAALEHLSRTCDMPAINKAIALLQKEMDNALPQLQAYRAA